MTAKRFEFREINEPPMVPKIYDTEKQEYANLFECVDWLNELHEENQLLKLQVETKLFSRRELEKENEQLKKHIEEHSIDERLLDDLYFNQVGGI